MSVKKEYLMISHTQLVRADEHLQTFYAPSEVDCEGINDSYKKYDRFNPVYFVERIIDNTTFNQVIDGWKYVEFAKSNGIEKVYACKLTIDDNDDLVKIMIQLQRSNHESLIELFKIIMVLWALFFKGPGFRSDLEEAELEKPIVSLDGSRPLNIYEKIGQTLYISGNKVKHIRKVGMVNPLFFERIEQSRFTLYGAYLECVKEEKGEMPAPPAVKAPTFFTTSTETPTFSTPTTTAETDIEDADDVSKINASTGTNNTNAVPSETTTQTADNSEFIWVIGICEGCGKETKIKINKNQIK